MNENGNMPGKGAATGSLVCGIVGIVVALLFGLIGCIIGLILGIVGVVLAGKAKNEGFVGGMRTAGFVLSVISVVFGVVGAILAIACIGAIGAMGGL